MASLRDIKRRIVSVKSTQKITRAMKMVAASKLRRAQDVIGKARPYAHLMRDMVTRLAARAELDRHPILRRGTGAGAIAMIVVTSDRGLCGGFNSSIVNGALRTIAEDFGERDVELTVVGRKGLELLKRRDCSIDRSHTDVLDGPVSDAARDIIAEAVADFSTGRYDEVHCLYNEFRSAISQQMTLEQLLPFETPEAEVGDTTVDYIYEPSVGVVFEALLTKHMEIQMQRILYESAASEHGARMTAMDSATTNAGEIIDHLTLKYNRARQDSITRELIEVVSGSEAL